MGRDLASLLPAWCASATGKGHACIASGERKKTALLVQGGKHVGWFAFEAASGRDYTCKREQKNGLPIHVFYACKIILLFVVVKLFR